MLEQAAEIRSQRLHTPFLDNQVVRAARALPEALRVQPGARASILRSVLEGAGCGICRRGGDAGVATSAVAARTGLRVAAGSLISLFDTPLLAEAGLVEARVVRKALRGRRRGGAAAGRAGGSGGAGGVAAAAAGAAGDVLDGDAGAAAGGAGRDRAAAGGAGGGGSGVPVRGLCSVG